MKKKNPLVLSDRFCLDSFKGSYFLMTPSFPFPGSPFLMLLFKVF